MPPPLRVIVICTGNSCRSQMAEGWFNHLSHGRFLSVSAGSQPAGYVHPMAIEVMGEVGIDLREKESKSLIQFLGQEFDYVITVCDDAAEACPVFPGPGIRIHWSIADPAKSIGSKNEVREAFHASRDLIRRRIEEFLQHEASIDPSHSI